MADYFTTRAKVSNIPNGQFSTVMRPFTAAQAAQKRWGFKDFDPVPGLPSGRGTFMPVGYTQTPPPAASIESEWATPELLKDFLIMMEGTRKPIAPEEVFKGLIGPTGGPLLAGVAKAGIKGSVDPSTLRVNVFHGGPHKWAAEPKFPQGRPRLDKIGTGEGAQAYGYGFYSAEAPVVARSYTAESNIQNAVLINGSRPDLTNPVEFAANEVAKMGKYANRGNMAKEWAAFPFIDPSLPIPGKDQKKFFKQVSEILASDAPLPKTEIGSFFYKLDIPDKDIAKYLDWDAPLSKQTEGVRDFFGFKKPADLPNKDELLKKVVETGSDNPAFKYKVDDPNSIAAPTPKQAVDAFYNNMENSLSRRGVSGKDAYTKLSRQLASQHNDPTGQQAASEALRKAGIPGLKYYDQMSRGKSGGKGTRNYVTWDQDVLNRAKILDE